MVTFEMTTNIIAYHLLTPHIKPSSGQGILQPGPTDAISDVQHLSSRWKAFSLVLRETPWPYTQGCSVSQPKKKDLNVIQKPYQT